jgi:hypothetical protein
MAIDSAGDAMTGAVMTATLPSSNFPIFTLLPTFGTRGVWLTEKDNANTNTLQAE